MGDSAITVRASICSVMRMIPISAVRAEPASPVTNTAQRTGPSSRMRASATAGPRKPSAPKRDRVRKICNPSTMPVNAPVRITRVSDRDPMKWMRSISRPTLNGGTKTSTSAWARKRPNRPRRLHARRG